jgi:23S rRNA (cytidine2498-2'-O)-methyltransferase
MTVTPQFVFVACQVGAVAAVKWEVARLWPQWRPAFSRPGFVTFKLPPGSVLAEDFDLRSVFARAYGFSLGTVRGESLEELAQQAWRLVAGLPVRRIHAFSRDTAEPGWRDFEPGLNADALAAHAALIQSCPQPTLLAPVAADPKRPARRGELVLDCVLVEPGLWCVGFHRADSISSRWPGGMMPLELPPDAVSRAWLKTEEALRWSELPIPPGARVAEIGSAPGGSSQALLARGFLVTGIDPAEMHPAVLAHPNFHHLRKRSTQVRRREFRKIRWLVVDMNVTPNYTLTAVEAIVTHPQVNIRGMLLTLKLTNWRLAERVPEYLERVRSWGYNIVRARQLQHNRREICVAALQKPFRRKPPLRKPARRRQAPPAAQSG